MELSVKPSGKQRWLKALSIRVGAFLYNRTHKLTCKCEHCGAVVKNNRRTSCAILGLALIWAGLAFLWTWPFMLITSGAVLFVGALCSYLPDEPPSGKRSDVL